MSQTTNGDAVAPLKVGLVNNMPDAALTISERQFGDLLREALPERPIELCLFEIPQIPRHPEIRARMAARYRPVEDLAEVAPDVLVVTGADPGERPMREAAFWPGFARVADWASEAERPTLWSCLAAHAAADYMHGVMRQRLPQKLSGFYSVRPNGPSPALAGLGDAWTVPHSRYNGLNEAELGANGYQILTRSDTVGADCFLGPGSSRFLFCQGHPEYDGDSIALEFRRDLRAYLQGERETLSQLPLGVFEGELAETLAALRHEALERPSPDLLRQWPASLMPQARIRPWRGFAVGLVANWLRSVL